MTNWERYFGSPEAAMRMEVRMMRDGRRFKISLSECNPFTTCAFASSWVRDFGSWGEYLDWLKAEYDDGNHQVGGRMSRPGCNRGCLLVIAVSLLIDGLTLWAAVSLARMIIGG